jgi:thiol-disulfide isomerase/thioredoxin
MRNGLLRAALAAVTCVALLGLAGGETMPNFEGGAGWLNSPPLSPDQLRGKIVLVDFWEYTCVNCLRTLPYLRAWYARYHDDGLVIVGVHTPEFLFSQDRSNVASAVQRLDVTWPVVLDDNYAIWKRFDNDEWPHEYLFDQQGKLVEGVAGEGFYQRTEGKIQDLIRASNPQAKLPAVMALLPQDNYTKPGAVCYPKTPEILIGRSRIADPPMAMMGSGGPGGNAPAGGDQNFIDPGGTHGDGDIYLNGYWHPADGGIISGGSGGYVSLQYHAIQAVAVMRSDNGTARVTVTQDGKPIAHEDAGADIKYDDRGNSYVEVSQPREYELVMNAAFGHHDLRLSPSNYGVGIFSFDFESCEVPGSRSSS